MCYMPKSRKKARALAKVTKDDVIRFRVSSEHKAAMLAAAARDGLEVSAWLRQLALRAAGVLPDPGAKR
jgi:hypothetical protein